MIGSGSLAEGLINGIRGRECATRKRDGGADADGDWQTEVFSQSGD